MPRHVLAVSLWIKSNEKVFRFFGVFFYILTAVVGGLWLAGCDVESVAFVLGCMSSSMFGVVEVAKYVVPDRKAVRDMGIDELLFFVQSSNAATDWKTINTEVVAEAALNEDPRLRVTIRYDERGVHTEDFQEPWANNGFADPKAKGYWVEVTYDRVLIYRHVFVSVDGGRAMLPMPKSRTDLTFSKLSYRLAQLFDSLSTLDEYANRAGLTNDA